MVAVNVHRVAGDSAAFDEFGDPVLPDGAPADVWPVHHVEPGARIAWATPMMDWQRGMVVVTDPVVYFRNRVPDIIPGDRLTAHGETLIVVEVNQWEHPTQEGRIMGTEIRCRKGQGEHESNVE